jgi:putative transposase
MYVNEHTWKHKLLIMYVSLLEKYLHKSNFSRSCRTTFVTRRLFPASGHEYEFKTLEQLQKAMEEYIEYYNNERIQVKLKGLTPCQARNQSLYSF